MSYNVNAGLLYFIIVCTGQSLTYNLEIEWNDIWTPHKFNVVVFNTEIWGTLPKCESCIKERIKTISWYCIKFKVNKKRNQFTQLVQSIIIHRL